MDQGSDSRRRPARRRGGRSQWRARRTATQSPEGLVLQPEQPSIVTEQGLGRPGPPARRVSNRRRRPQRRRSRLPLIALLALALLVIALVAVYFSRRGGASAETVTFPSHPQVLLVRVDPALSQQLQSGQLAIASIPTGKIGYFQERRDPDGNVQRDYSGRPLRLPWVADDPPLVDNSGLTSLSNPGSDPSGRPCIEIRLSSDASQKLAAEAPPGTRLAVVADGELRNFVDIPTDMSDTLSFTCGWADARQLTAMFANGSVAGS